MSITPAQAVENIASVIKVFRTENTRGACCAGATRRDAQRCTGAKSA
jgi:hypothetical protein